MTSLPIPRRPVVRPADSRIGEHTIEYLPNGLIRVFDRGAKWMGCYDPSNNTCIGPMPDRITRHAIRQHAASLLVQA